MIELYNCVLWLHLIHIFNKNLFKNELEIICDAKFCVNDLCESYSCAKLIDIIAIIKTITSYAHPIIGVALNKLVTFYFI